MDQTSRGVGAGMAPEPAHASFGSMWDQALAALGRLYPLPPAMTVWLVAAGAALGVLGDGLLYTPGPPGVNLSLWIASVAAAALALERRMAVGLDLGRAAWLGVGVMFAAGLAWRDAPPLKLLALGCAAVAFALAAYRLDGSWVRRAGVLRYAAALALGAVHAWTAATLTLLEATTSGRPTERGPGRRRSAAVARGLLIAAPLVAVFGALLVSADAAFEALVRNLLQFDLDRLASHVVVFAVLAWLSIGYLRGFLSGTEPRAFSKEASPAGGTAKHLSLGITEVATALAALDLLFLLFVVLQLRYLFGGEALVRTTPGLTYAEYARRGFFELVFAAVLVIPVLLAADGLLERRSRRDALVFRLLAGLQIALMLAIAASALERLRLYRAAYGLTESRFYAAALLLWTGAMLLWLAATVLRGRREEFAFGLLTSGLAAVALLFFINPDAVIARTNLARLASGPAPGRFDAAYVASLSADAVPVLVAALDSLPPEAQCRLARRLLRRWGPEREASLRDWNWSVARARDAVSAHQGRLRAALGPGQTCPP